MYGTIFRMPVVNVAFNTCLFLQLVSGSAVMAFEELCPDRVDLIHKNYRKLCNLLVDIDEWGQSAVIHMLTRYARSQFVDPNKAVRLMLDVLFHHLPCSLYLIGRFLCRQVAISL